MRNELDLTTCTTAELSDSDLDAVVAGKSGGEGESSDRPVDVTGAP